MALAWSEIEPPSPAGKTVNDFCDLGSGVMVAVGTSGLAYRSTDGGESWSSVTLAEANTMTGLAYDGSSVLVAVSSTGVNRIQRSTDGGQSWTAIAAPVVAGWQSVCWDPTNAKFIAVASSGAGNRTMNSGDGSTWTSHAAIAAKAWSWVCANTAVVVAAAFGTGTQMIMTSTDGGGTWSLQTHTSWSVGQGVSQGSSGLAWSAAVGVFAISAKNGATCGIMTSPTAVTWTLQTLPDTTQRVIAIVAAPSLGAFVATQVRAAGGGIVLTATAAASWTALDPAIYRDWTASGWSDATGTFVSWDTSGHTPQTILYGLNVAFSSLSPSRGTKAGGTVVTLTGLGLLSVAQGDVLFDGTAALAVTPAADGLSLTCLVPAHVVGPVDVTITGIGTLTGGYTYVSVDRVIPRSGSVLGGQAITIRGYGFDLATSVLIGGSAVTDFLVVSNTTITATTPVHGSDLVDVEVVNVDTGADLYTYAVSTALLPPPPVFAAVDAQGGLMSSEWTDWFLALKKRIEQPIAIGAEQVTGVFQVDQIPTLPWTKISKTGSSLGDLDERNANDINNGLLGVRYGGTHLGAYIAGDLLYATGTEVLSALGIGAATTFLKSTGTAPAWTAGAALTKTNDTNVTATLGGSATTALVNAASITLGWTGQLAVPRGGTGLATIAAGGLLYGSALDTVSVRTIGSALDVLTPSGGFPTWAALSTLGSGDLTRVSDTNVTLTLGGTPTGSLFKSVSITAGWSGTLSALRGGTALDTSGSTGVAQVAAGTWSVTTTLQTAVQGNIVRTGALDAGSITSGFGSINVGSDAITGGAFTGTTGAFTTAATTGTGFTISQTGLTTGIGLSVIGSSATPGQDSTGADSAILKVSGNLGSTHTGNPPVTHAIYSGVTLNSTTAFASAANGMFVTAVSNTLNLAEAFGLYSRMTDNTTLANILHGVDIDISSTANANKTIYALSGTATVQSATANTLYGLNYGAINSGAPTSGTQTTTGGLLTATSTGTNGGTANVTGLDVTADGTVLSGTINAIGVRIRNGTMSTVGTSKQVGLQIDALSGADTNYAAIFAGGNVGIGTSTPTAVLHSHNTSTGTNSGLFSNTGEAQFTIWSDTGGISADTDVFIRFVIDAGQTLKTFLGYDQGTDKSLFGYNGAAVITVDANGNAYVNGAPAAAAATGTKGLLLGDGTAITGLSGLNLAGVYADDVSGTVNLFSINENDEVGRLTPGGAQIPRDYACGSFTIQTGRYVIASGLTLSGTQAVTINGTGKLVLI